MSFQKYMSDAYRREIELMAEKELPAEWMENRFETMMALEQAEQRFWSGLHFY